jgi:hypothetical protein
MEERKKHGSPGVKENVKKSKETRDSFLNGLLI